MGKRAVILMITALTMAACMTNTRYPVMGDRMVFSAVASHTKCIITSTSYPTDLPFIVEAVHYPDGTEQDWDQVYMAGETIEYDPQNAWWQPQEEFLWPLGGDVVFYAATPAISKISISPEVGVETDWAVHTFADAQIDFCIAKTVEPCSHHSAVVPIVFDHALTQVCVKVRPLKQYSATQRVDDMLQTDEITVVLDSVKLSGILAEGHFIQATKKWETIPSVTENYTLYNDPAGQALSCDKYDNPELTVLPPMLLIPQVLPKGAHIEEWHHTVVHSFVKDLTSGEIVSELNYTIPATSTLPLQLCCQRWIPGYKYTFHLSLGMEDPLLTLAVTDWIETKEIILSDE